jgi:hypothetical protein
LVAQASGQDSGSLEHYSDGLAFLFWTDWGLGCSQLTIVDAGDPTAPHFAGQLDVSPLHGVVRLGDHLVLSSYTRWR